MSTRSISYDVATKLLTRPGYVLTVTFVNTKRGREFSIIGKNGGPSGPITEATGVRLLAHPKIYPVDRGLLPDCAQTFSFLNPNRTKKTPVTGGPGSHAA
jgi:hypothetical protein